MAHLLTIRQTAERLALSDKTVSRLIDRGALESVKIGNARRIVAQSLDDYVDGLRDEAVTV